MKRLLLITALMMAFIGHAQDRVNSAPTELEWKSKEIKKALYWDKNDSGKWVSRKNNKIKYLGQGVRCPNFSSLFIGKYNGENYIFCDFEDYYWEYPNIKKYWMHTPSISQTLISEDDINALKNLQPGDKYTIKSTFSEKMSRKHPEYSFPLFLRINNTLLGTDRSIHKDKPSLPQYIFKRTVDSEGNDVVRFLLPGEANTGLIDSWYFEVGYPTFLTLFEEDKKKTYK